MLLLDLLDRSGEGLGKAAWAAASASAWRGRGRRGVNPTRRSDTQPKCALTARPVDVWIHAATFGPVHIPPSGAGPSRAVASATSWAAESTRAEPGF